MPRYYPAQKMYLEQSVLFIFMVIQPACQVQFNPKLVAHIGLVHGEGCERGWSMLSHHNVATQYMTEYKHHLFLTVLVNHSRTKGRITW